jgi:hypothetical protein
VPAAEARDDRVLKIRHDVAQAFELIDNPLVLAELILNLFEPRFDLGDDHADDVAKPATSCTSVTQRSVPTTAFSTSRPPTATP